MFRHRGAILRELLCSLLKLRTIIILQNVMVKIKSWTILAVFNNFINFNQLNFNHHIL